MVSENFVKNRALLLTAISIVFYPIFLFFVILVEISRTLFKKKISKNISGEIAVVTGGARGLGKEISIELAKNGSHIAVVDVNLMEAQNTAKFINETYKVKTKAYEADISNYNEVVKLKDDVARDLGPPTILVNNAGILTFTNPVEPDYKEVQRMINVNLTAHIWTNRIFLPKMKEMGKGHIVAISSIAGIFPISHIAEYTSTKFGVRSLMRVWRQELKANGMKNIVTTTVIPTFLKTNDQVTRISRESGIDTIYPLVEGKEAASRIVQGILHNEEEVVIPEFYALHYRFLELLPITWQDWIMIQMVNIVQSKYLQCRTQH